MMTIAGGHCSCWTGASGWRSPAGSPVFSYAMIGTYADVVARADTLGWDELAEMDDEDLGAMVRPLGLAAARVGYLRSLAGFIEGVSAPTSGLGLTRPEDLIGPFATSVHGAGYKVAQCAALYAGGYHCGIIPVDSGMITRLAPFAVSTRQRPGRTRAVPALATGLHGRPRRCLP